MPLPFTEAQVAVVQAIAADAPGPNWERLVADIEIEEDAEHYHYNTVALAVMKADDGTLTDPSFSVSIPAREAVAELYRSRKASGQEPFGGFQLRIERDGSYRFDFEYGPPKRMNGVWDEAKETMLDNYLQHYRAEMSQR